MNQKEENNETGELCNMRRKSTDEETESQRVEPHIIAPNGNRLPNIFKSNNLHLVLRKYLIIYH